MTIKQAETCDQLIKLAIKTITPLEPTADKDGKKNARWSAKANDKPDHDEFCIVVAKEGETCPVKVGDNVVATLRHFDAVGEKPAFAAYYFKEVYSKAFVAAKANTLTSEIANEKKRAAIVFERTIERTVALSIADLEAEFKA